MEGENKTSGAFCGGWWQWPMTGGSQSALHFRSKANRHTQSQRPRAVQGSEDNGVGLGHGGF